MQTYNTEVKPVYNPAIEAVIQYFTYNHLPNHLQEVSKLFYDLAYQIANKAPDSRETTVCLRKLLEAKDAAVRAVIQ